MQIKLGQSPAFMLVQNGLGLVQNGLGLGLTIRIFLWACRHACMYTAAWAVFGWAEKRVGMLLLI